LAPHGLNAVRARNFWTDETVRIKGDHVTAKLAPHSCQLLDFDRQQN
jgi:hypothetical protein